MNILMIGDIVGNSGCNKVYTSLGKIIKEYKIDFCVANCENSAQGNGILLNIAHNLFNVGVDVITMGNHTFSKKDVLELFLEDSGVIRPANYPPKTPGDGYFIKDVGGVRVAVINAMGRVFMEALDCPFRAVDAILKQIDGKCDITVVDFHAEATSEKMAMGYHLDGRVSAVFGTHTHVQTADEMVLPKGTAYITDVGMSGPVGTILGVDKMTVIDRFISKVPRRFESSDAAAFISGAVVDVNEENGRARSIERIFVK